jgi:hypothetical protein
MVLKTEQKRSNRRRCVPIVGRLEDRGLLSAVGAELAHVAAVSLHSPHLAEVHSIANPIAQREVKAHPSWTIHFPGGSVSISPGHTHVKFPGGSVHASRHGAIVTFPGGYVVAGFGHTVVRFPGGSITV